MDMDSARAVALAISSLEKEDESSPLEVHQFERVANGFRVTLLPAGNVLGGGGVVAVSRDGRAEVLSRFQ